LCWSIGFDFSVRELVLRGFFGYEPQIGRFRVLKSDLLH
jgi:hypothetical protein